MDCGDGAPVIPNVLAVTARANRWMRAGCTGKGCRQDGCHRPEACVMQRADEVLDIYWKRGAESVPKCHGRIHNRYTIVTRSQDCWRASCWETSTWGFGGGGLEKRILADGCSPARYPYFLGHAVANRFPRNGYGDSRREADGFRHSRLGWPELRPTRGPVTRGSSSSNGRRAPPSPGACRQTNEDWDPTCR